jgi:hypothetical protein
LTGVIGSGALGISTCGRLCVDQISKRPKGTPGYWQGSSTTRSGRAANLWMLPDRCGKSDPIGRRTS